MAPCGSARPAGLLVELKEGDGVGYHGEDSQREQVELEKAVLDLTQRVTVPVVHKGLFATVRFYRQNRLG